MGVSHHKEKINFKLNLICLKSTLSDLEPQILCVLSNNVEATDLSLLGFFLWVSFRIYLPYSGYNIIAMFFHLMMFLFEDSDNVFFP